MKREIFCKECKEKHFDTLPLSEPGEWSWCVSGVLSQSCLCDFCNKELERGTAASAVSFGLGRNPHNGWESEFIT